MKYQPVIGLEIHVQLKTKSKMFCSSLNNPEETKPNLNICPVCTGQPGTLPVINNQAVEYVIRTGLALNCQIPQFSKFDRKNYFYPDLPKGYQISQYDKPLAIKGFLDIDSHKIRITRVHLEEDTGRLVHPEGEDYSLVDFNRAGTPLMELVTEPDIKSGAEAKKFCQQLQLILKYLGVSSADMEKGEMRCEVNISLKKGKKLGTKVEIKNLNSFKAVEKSIDYEIIRQSDVLKERKKVIQETRGWDEAKGITFSQRTKEGAPDYRYFPEPDLPPLVLKKTWIKNIEESLPELPIDRKKRFAKQFKLPPNDVEILVNNKELGDYFEKSVSEFQRWAKDEKIKASPNKLVKITANYILTELQKLLFQSQANINDCQITPENFAELMTMIFKNEISSSSAQEVLAYMFSKGGDPSTIIKEKDLTQISGEKDLEEAAAKVIKNNPQAVADYKKGKEQSLQFLVGQVMKETKGKANPAIVGQILRKKLAN